jgi:ppGpp synthetase/RelA/SpoT-type nucleotidyltranferase
MTQQPKTAKSAKPSFEDYPKWAVDNLKFNFSEETKNRFGANTASLLTQVRTCAFYEELAAFLLEAEREYESKHHVKLLMTKDTPQFVEKSYDSTINKTYRSNILENFKFPNEPRWGWTTHDNVYTQLQDLIRTTIFCRYLDGPAFLAEKLLELAKKHSLQGAEVRSQERDSGYYAYHFYAQLPATFFDEKWGQRKADVTFEIQITTQMQEVLRELSHSFYEEHRISLDVDQKWKWDHSAPRFRASLMGHTLHLLEGVLLELRDKKNESAGEKK